MVNAGEVEDPLEEGMAAHSSILAWKIPCTEEPGGLQSMGGSQESGMTERLKNNTEHHDAQYRNKKMNHTHKDKSSRRTQEGKATPRTGWSGPQRVGQAGSLMAERDFQLGD